MSGFAPKRRPNAQLVLTPFSHSDPPTAPHGPWHGWVAMPATVQLLLWPDLCAAALTQPDGNHAKSANRPQLVQEQPPSRRAGTGAIPAVTSTGSSSSARYAPPAAAASSTTSSSSKQQQQQQQQ